MRLHEKAEPFIKHLQRYKDDRGARAKLRGALSPARRHLVWPLLGHYLNESYLRTFEVVAALWAEADGGKSGVDLGTAMRRLAGDYSTFEGRFKRLLTCEKDELSDRVAPIVRALNTKGIALDYALLLSDMLWWGDSVKVRWAQGFWGVDVNEAEVPEELIPKTSGEVDQ